VEKPENIIAAGCGREQEEQKAEEEKHKWSCTTNVNHMPVEGARQVSSIETKGRQKRSLKGRSIGLNMHMPGLG